MCIPDEYFFYTYMLLFLIQDLGSGDEKVRKSDVKKFLTPGYSTSGHVELYTVSLKNVHIQV